MKVYIDATIYSLQKNGGVTRYTQELIHGLADLGHTVIVFVHPHYQTLPPVHAHIHTHFIPALPIGKRLSKLIDPLYSALWLKRFFREHSITEGIFHSIYLSYYHGIPLPQIVTIYDTTRERFPSSFNAQTNMLVHAVTARSIKKNDAIICISEQTRHDVISFFSPGPQKLHVTHLGVSPLFFFPEKTTRHPSAIESILPEEYILFVGTRVAYKNFSTFVTAFAQWDRKDDMILVTVGGGAFTPEETLLLNSLGVANHHVHFGSVTEDELRSLYKSASVFVFPSISEGFGLPLVEAMASGVPCAVSDILAFREIGLHIPEYFDPFDVSSIVGAMEKALRKTPQIITAGIALAGTYTWKKTVQQTIDIYAKLYR